VLDASAVVRIIEGSTQADSFTEAVSSAELVLAPELILTEVANALWLLQRAGQLKATTLQACIRLPLFGAGTTGGGLAAERRSTHA
jgi:predicted nucleic acid-binding protein